jgi:Uncharacterised nucleotidyltransferase
VNTARLPDNAAVGSAVKPTDEECGICARLSGEQGQLTAAIVEAARLHGVHLLIAASLKGTERAQPWADRLLRELRTAAVFYERREAVLRGALDALGTAVVDALILKGAALAYTVYSAPYLRPRVDIDLLIAREDVERAERVLAADGWVRDIESDKELAAAQRHYTKSLGLRAEAEHLDLHWRVVNPVAFAHALTFEELRPRAIPIPALGPVARTLCIGDALVLACLHLSAHHLDNSAGDGATVPLVWLFDIHLLIGRLDAIERQRFVAGATRRNVAAACRRALELTNQRFATLAAAALIADLPDVADVRIGRPVTPMTLLREDLAALPSWRQRATLVREHLFPSMAYIRSKYPTWPVVLLPIASLHRIVVGAPNWVRPRKRQSSG